MAPTKEEALRRAVKGLSRPLAELVEDGIRLGWKPTLSPTGVLLLGSPGLLDEHEVIPIPRNERNVRSTTLTRFHRKIRRFADPAKLTDLDQQHLGEIPEEEEREIALEPKAKPGMPTAPPPDRPVEEVELPDSDQAMYQRQDDAAVARDEELRGPVDQEDAPYVCEDCDPPSTWPSRRALAAHRPIHTGKQVRRKARRLKCRFPGCERIFYGLQAGYQRGGHETRAHGRRNGQFPDTPREEPMTNTPQTGDMPPQDALEMIVSTLREAGVIESNDAVVADLSEKLRTANAELEKALRQRDDAIEQLNVIKKAFKSLNT